MVRRLWSGCGRRNRSGIRRTWVCLGERGRRDNAFQARWGESLVSLVIFKDVLKSDVSYCTLGWWNGPGVNRDFVDFLDQEREVELAEVMSAETDEKLAVMQD